MLQYQIICIDLIIAFIGSEVFFYKYFFGLYVTMYVAKSDYL